MNMKHLGIKPGQPMSSKDDEERVYYPGITVRASHFPEIAKMRDGDEGHVTMRFRKMGSRLHDNKQDADVNLDLTHMGYEGNEEEEDGGDFTDRIGYSVHHQYRHGRT